MVLSKTGSAEVDRCEISSMIREMNGMCESGFISKLFCVSVKLLPVPGRFYRALTRSGIM